MPDAFERVLDALAAHGCRVQRRGDRARSSCPSHTDKTPSLSIDRKGSVVLVKCFGGCLTARVIQAVGLRFSDLRDGPLPSPQAQGIREVVARYEYAHSDGTVYASKVRFAQKTFCWYRPAKTASGWRPGLQGLKPQLFGLEELVDSRRVLIVEGEKAVLLLRSKGYVSACPPFGASSWRDEWAEALWRAGGREVVILPDVDKPGKQFAEAVATSCLNWRPSFPITSVDDPWPETTLLPDDAEAESLTVKLIDLPGLHRGEDVYDWLTVHGHSEADLANAIAASHTWTPVDKIARKKALTAARVRKHRAKIKAMVTLERSARPATTQRREEVLV